MSNNSRHSYWVVILSEAKDPQSLALAKKLVLRFAQDANQGGNLVIFQKRVPDLTQLALDRFVGRARRVTGLKGLVNVLLTSSAEMKSLNRRFRAKDKPTDVLSFPAEPGAGKQFAGEIAISAEVATKNARALGHSPAEEVKILALHGILHLRGYDHECDNGQMARREKQLRAKLHLPLGLIERTTPRRDGRRLSCGAKPRPVRLLAGQR